MYKNIKTATDPQGTGWESRTCESCRHNTPHGEWCEIYDQSTWGYFQPYDYDGPRNQGWDRACANYKIKKGGLKMMKTRTERLAQELALIAERHENEISALSYRGPRGGRNAKHIPGWRCMGNHAITRAAGLAGVPQMSYWSGSAPTPSTAIPACMADEALEAYKLIFAPGGIPRQKEETE